MTSVETDLSKLVVERVGLEKRDLAIDESLEAGHIAVHCAPLILGDQHINIHPNDEANISFWFNEFVSIREGSESRIEPITGVIKGFLYEGLFRRQGWLQKYVHLDESPVEIRQGDKVALRVPDGGLRNSAQVRSIQIPQVSMRLAHSIYPAPQVVYP